jgi:hypothetical protein
MVGQLVQYGEWLIPGPVLIAIAWVRFNSPPTNRSGTTFLMFSLGLTLYCLLVVVLWFLVIIAVSQGTLGFDKFHLTLGRANPQAQGEFAQYAPLVAALVMVAATHFSWVRRIDSAARAFCITLAAIPREADRLALELAQTAAFQPKTERVRGQVRKVITETVGAQALNFEPDGSLAARFTRAVGLYWLFIGPTSSGTPIEFANGNGKSAYTRIMQLSETKAKSAAARYQELMQAASACFATPHPSKELEEALNRSIGEVTQLTCNLIARYVLYCNATKSKRLRRLSTMGFDASGAIWSFGADQWVTTIFAVIVLSAGMMAFTPGMLRLTGGEILMISIPFGVSIGAAVIAAVWVAQRFMEHYDGETSHYPPTAELTAAALIVAGFSVALRIATPLVPALIRGSESALPDALAQFAERWPGVIIPFVCTISLGLLCIYLGGRPWSQVRVAAAGALGNGLAFMATAPVVAWLLSNDVLAKFYLHPEDARVRILINTALIGVAIGFMVLWQFKRSERARRDDAEHAAERARAGAPPHPAVDPPEALDSAAPPRPGVAAQSFGGYSYENVKTLEGRYVCFRPAFTSPGVISAYLMDLRWDDAASCLIFEEKDREDAGHTQRGRVYIPDGRPFMSFVTVAQGGIRLITVSRPGERDSARGLIMTLSNPSGMQFTPAGAPIVLKRVTEEITQLGFIRPGAPDYEYYRQELQAVAPAFGFFATAPRAAEGGGEEEGATPPQEHLSLVT